MLLLTLFSSFLTAVNSPNLDAMRWHHRVILLFASNAVDSQLLQQRQAFIQQTAGLAERDIRVFELIGPSEANDKLRERFDAPSKEFAVILLGKDGTQKLHSTLPVEPLKLFQLVDSMPMRRNEMNRLPKTSISR